MQATCCRGSSSSRSGSGLTFVPLTLTAVAGVRAEDSGASSAALNTAQQIGGAIGLAALTTVFTHAFADRMTALAGPIQGQAQSGAITADQAQAAMAHAQLVAQTDGSTRGFLVGAGMILIGSPGRVPRPERQARGAGVTRGGSRTPLRLTRQNADP